MPLRWEYHNPRLKNGLADTQQQTISLLCLCLCVSMCFYSITVNCTEEAHECSLAKGSSPIKHRCHPEIWTHGHKRATEVSYGLLIKCVVTQESYKWSHPTVLT